MLPQPVFNLQHSDNFGARNAVMVKSMQLRFVKAWQATDQIQLPQIGNELVNQRIMGVARSYA